MPRLRQLSGDEVIAILARFGFQIYSQKGSHVKMRRTLESGRRQNLTVPRHRELATGTLHSIVTQAARFVPEDELRAHFHTD